MESNALKKDNLCGVLKRGLVCRKTVPVLKNCFHQIWEYSGRMSPLIPVPGGKKLNEDFLEYIRNKYN
jgi:hypothetical protein